MDIIKIISTELEITDKQTEAVIALIDEGNTIPFIARYRKEKTGALNDEVLRKFDERLRYLRSLDERREAILKSIEEQGKLTPQLKKQIDAAETLVALEDLYLPYKKKRRTRAMIAREKGLAPLAEYMKRTDADVPVEAFASQFLDEEKGVASVEEAIQGAEDILAEEISDNAQYRSFIRRKTFADGLLVSAKKGDAEESVYENYYDYSEPMKNIPGHRILAMNRGEKEKVLSIKVEAPVEDIETYLNLKVGVPKHPVTGRYLEESANDAYKRLIAPSIENDLRGEMTANAQEAAITVFGKNLTQLLMQPPVAGKCVLGWDPAFRTGCKLAVVDATGKVLDTVVIYPTAPTNEKKIRDAKNTLKKLVDKYGVDIISVGNGTASRESEQVIVDFIKELQAQDPPAGCRPDLYKKLSYVIVNEAGASVYSASELATEEFPNFDVGQRSAASIARRLQDPLAELVKIDPKSIGVGQYQHDMNQTRLSEALTGVVEDCVNRVGVDVNTASAALLSYISGINKTIAKNIVVYRETNGTFANRRTLLKVPKLGPKAFEQSAGFLRISGGTEPLDMTGVHPESYEAARLLLARMGFAETDVAQGKTAEIRKKLKRVDEKKLAAELGVGEYTLRDIIDELEKPGRDPREKLDGPILRSDVMDIEDLEPGMVLKGTVRNVIDFGAFVDIGVHQDGLVHISQIADRYVKHPLDVVSVGDVVTVKVLSVDAAKKRISLSMRGL
ncbi:MAG: Tex family protein [Lachnospiraceae bacterium]|nr:Tex family protein [Lachnospiraceae bacterium]